MPGCLTLVRALEGATRDGRMNTPWICTLKCDEPWGGGRIGQLQLATHTGHCRSAHTTDSSAVPVGVLRATSVPVGDEPDHIHVLLPPSQPQSPVHIPKSILQVSTKKWWVLTPSTDFFLLSGYQPLVH